MGGKVDSGESRSDQGAEEAHPALWENVREDVEELFGDNVDITIEDYGNHLDVRVIPNGEVSEIASKHDVEIVPYNACRMTIRKGK